MTAPDVEARVVAAFADAREQVDANPDLFARVARSLEDSRARRRFRLRLVGMIAAFVAANAALALTLSALAAGSVPDDRRSTMPWWVIEVITNIVLVALAIGLGPFIKRFGRAYAADVFRANPRTGKSYLVLTDVAYYLIFTAFILFTVTFVPPDDWDVSPGNQWKHEVARVGGILLIMGILHAANVVALPVIGHLLSGTRDPNDSAPARRSTRPAGSDGEAGGPPLGPGTWLLRVEPFTEPPDAPEPAGTAG